MWPFKTKTLPPDEPAYPFVEKRRVTMVSVDETHAATDYVPLEWVPAYVADARARWGRVYVGNHHECGPGGDNQPPANLEHLRELRTQLEASNGD